MVGVRLFESFDDFVSEIILLIICVFFELMLYLYIRATYQKFMEYDLCNLYFYTFISLCFMEHKTCNVP